MSHGFAEDWYFYIYYDGKIVPGDNKVITPDNN
jgi:hypothetical protein